MSAIQEITDKVESTIADAVAKYRALDAAIESNPVVKAAMDVADDVAPEVKAAAATIVPLLTGVHVSAIDGVLSVIRAVVDAAPKATPAA